MNNSRKSSTAFNGINCPQGLLAFCLMTVLQIALLLHVMSLNGMLGCASARLEKPEDYAAVNAENYMPQFSHYGLPDQYALLADSLIHGRPWLDVPVDAALSALEDPYNTQDRIASAGETAPVFWDVAFFEGRYYCYFGVVPAVVIYAPFQLLTGYMLPTPWAIAFLAAMATIAINAFLWRAAKRWFASSATAAWLCGCSCLTLLACNFMYLVFVAKFYSVPILCAYAVTFFGLWFWAGAERAIKPVNAEGESLKAEAWPGAMSPKTYLSSVRIAAGSALMALNLGCRPQMLAAALLAFPIFWNQIFNSRLLFSRQGLRPTLAGVAPFLIVAAPILAYNAARFGSPFNFGSAYNLTGFDMQEYRQSGRITALLGLLYLFGPIVFTRSFPFIAPEDNAWIWAIEWAPNEPFFGGFFLMKPVVTFGLLVFLWMLGKNFKAMPVALKVMAALGLLMPPVVILFDVRAAGITERYFSDFGYWYALLACAGLLAFKECVADKAAKGKWLGVAVALLLLATFVLNYAALWSPLHYDSIEFLNPSLWGAITTLGNG